MWVAYVYVILGLSFTRGKIIEFKTHEYLRASNPALAYMARYPWKQREISRIMQYATSAPVSRAAGQEIIGKLLLDLKENEKSTTRPVDMQSVFRKWRRERVKEMILNRLVKLTKKVVEDQKTTERNKINNKDGASSNDQKKTHQPGFSFQKDKKLHQRTKTIKKDGIVLSVFKNTKHREQRDKTDTDVSRDTTTSMIVEKVKDPYDNIIDFLFLYPSATKRPKYKAKNSHVRTTIDAASNHSKIDKLLFPKLLLKAIFPKVNIIFNNDAFNYKTANTNITYLYDVNQTSVKHNSKEWLKNKLAEMSRLRQPSLPRWRESELKRVLAYVLPNKRNKVQIKLRSIADRKLRERRQTKNLQNANTTTRQVGTDYVPIHRRKKSKARSVASFFVSGNWNNLAVLPLPETKVPHISVSTKQQKGIKHEYNPTTKKVTLDDLFQLMHKHEATLDEINQTLKKIASFNEIMFQPRNPDGRFTELKELLELQPEALKTESNKTKETLEEQNEEMSHLFPQWYGSDQYLDPSIKQAHYQTKLFNIGNRIIREETIPEKHHKCMLDAYSSNDNIKSKHKKREIHFDPESPYNDDSSNGDTDEEVLKLSDDLFDSNENHVVFPGNDDLEVEGYYRNTPPTTPKARHKYPRQHTIDSPNQNHISTMISTPVERDGTFISTGITKLPPKVSVPLTNYRSYWDQLKPNKNIPKPIAPNEEPRKQSEVRSIKNMLGKTFTIRRKRLRNKADEKSHYKMTPDHVHRVEVIVYGKMPGTNQTEVRPVQKFTIFNNKNDRKFKMTDDFRSETLLLNPYITKFLPFNPKDLLKGTSEAVSSSTVRNVTTTTLMTKATTKLVTLSPTTSVTQTTTTPTTTSTTTEIPTTTEDITIKLIKVTPRSKQAHIFFTNNDDYEDRKATTLIEERNPEQLVINYETASKHSNNNKAYEALDAVKIVNELSIHSLNEDFVPVDHKFTPKAKQFKLELPLHKKKNKNRTTANSSVNRKKTEFLSIKHYPYIIETLDKGDPKEVKRRRNELLNSNHLIDLWIQHKIMPQERSSIGGVSPLELWRNVLLKRHNKDNNLLSSYKNGVLKSESKSKPDNEVFYEYFDEDFGAKRKKRGVNGQLLCTVMRKSKEEHMVHHIKNTWGKRCDILLFISSKKAESRAYWEFVLAGLRFVFNSYHDVEWILKADVSTYIVVENLLVMLQVHDPDKPLYFGRPSYMDYNSFVMSREGLKRLATKGPETIECQYVQEVGIRPCLEVVGVKEINPVDQYKRALFYPFGPFSWNPAEKHKPEEALQTWSDYAVSFNNLGYRDLYTMEYFIYHINPLEVSQEYIDKVRNMTFEGEDQKRNRNRS